MFVGWTRFQFAERFLFRSNLAADYNVVGLFTVCSNVEEVVARAKRSKIIFHLLPKFIYIFHLEDIKNSKCVFPNSATVAVMIVYGQFLRTSANEKN